jgi:osmotically-inducible protein OsmY
MVNKTATAVLVALFAGSMAACSSTPGEEGAVERTAANAGRVIDDSAITAKVKSALAADPTTKAHQINVETFKGEVQLSGFVESDQARSRALQLARDIQGVRRVKDAMEVRTGG